MLPSFSNNNNNSNLTAPGAAGGGGNGTAVFQPTTEVYVYGRSVNNPKCTSMGLSGKDRDESRSGLKYVSTVDGLYISEIVHLRWATIWLALDSRRATGRSVHVMVDKNDRNPAMLRRLIKKQRLERVAAADVNQRADPDFYERHVRAFFDRCFRAERRLPKLVAAASGAKRSKANRAAAAEKPSDDDDEDAVDAAVLSRVEARFAQLPIPAPETTIDDVYHKRGAPLRVGSHVRVWMTNVYALGRVVQRDIDGLDENHFEIEWLRDDWEPEIVELSPEDEGIDELNDRRWQNLWFPTWDELTM